MASRTAWRDGDEPDTFCALFFCGSTDGRKDEEDGLANEVDDEAEDGWRSEPVVATEDDVRCELAWIAGMNELDALAPLDAPCRSGIGDIKDEDDDVERPLVGLAADVTEGNVNPGADEAVGRVLNRSVGQGAC